jgi:hypothetical protein
VGFWVAAKGVKSPWRRRRIRRCLGAEKESGSKVAEASKVVNGEWSKDDILVG